MNTANKKIAIIGGGIAGLTAGYLLNPKYDVTLFEKSGRVGGNAYTLTTPDGQQVDIAAAVFGRFSYENVFRLFKKLGIGTVCSCGLNFRNTSGLGASFYNLDTHEGMFLTLGFKGLLSQNFEILKPYRIKSVIRLVRGLKKAQTLLQQGELKGSTIEGALKKIPHLTEDAKMIFVTSLCLISSMHCNDVLDAPADFFIDKLNVYHDFVPPKALYSVCFTRNRTQKYVDALSAGYRDKIMFNSKIKTVIRRAQDVAVLTEDGRRMLFDKLVFACNADQALPLLDQPSLDEKRLLGAWRYTEGKIVVHTDHSHFPKKDLMKGFSFLYRNTARYLETSVSGSLWALPGVPDKSDLISTQHPNFPIQKDQILFEKIFRTPLFDFNSCATIPLLPSLNGVNNTYYCGSHFGFGLHEDAVTSAIRVAKNLGVDFV